MNTSIDSSVNSIVPLETHQVANDAYFLNTYLHVSLCRFDVEDVSLHLDGSMMMLIYFMKTCNVMLVLLYNSVTLRCTLIFFGCFLCLCDFITIIIDLFWFF